VKTVKLKSEVLRWVRERAGLGIDALAQKMKLPVEEVTKWETTGEIRLSMTKKLASYTRTPLGYLFLEEPLSDKLPIPDFRTVSDDQVKRTSPDLLETVQTMQRRQEWMREFLIEEGMGKLSFVGSASMNLKPEKIAAMIRESLGITEDWARKLPTWTDALRRLREIIDAAGILIFINGIIANNTHRKLDPEEFRGFVLCDEYAPLIFINGADARAAQMFTIAHELAHIWLGKEGVSNFDVMLPKAQKIEQICNQVAAEFLIPAHELKKYWPEAKENIEPYQHLARMFKVSPIVAARRCLDIEIIKRNEFFDFYNKYLHDERRIKGTKPGGDFWKTQNVRIGHRFGAAVVIAAKEGRLLYNDAYRLTDLKGITFENYAKNIGIPLR